MNTSKPVYIVFFMLSVSIVFGVALATVHQVTTDILSENEQFYKNRALSKAFLLQAEGQSPKDYEASIHRFLKKTQTLGEARAWETYVTTPPLEARVGFLFSGSGVWGPIQGILVLSQDLNTVINLQILEHQETPGLGARIEETWFTDQFKGLQIGWNESTEKRIIVGASLDPQAKNRVDAITGATQTSLALMKSLNTELDLFRAAHTKGEGN